METAGMSSKGNRFSLVALALCLGTFALGGCGAPAPAEQFTLRIGVFPTQDYLPYFVMQERGFAKQHGLRFEEKSYPAGAAVIEAMVAGTIDVGCSAAAPIAVAAERGLIPDKVVPVAVNTVADPEHPAVAVLAAAPVQSWKGLHGKYIAVPAMNSIATAAIKGRLILEGVKDYTLVEIPLANLGLAVAGGDVAAATILEPYLTQSLLRGDGKLLGWVIGGPPLERAEFTSIVFRSEFYRSNPQGVKAFLRAQLQAVKWINQNPEAARSTFAKRLGLTKEVGQKMHLVHWPMDARNDPASLEAVQRMMVEIGMLKAPIPAGRMYDETLLNEVLAEKR
jgi:NitT/TauT family transport system substrate-binding protein